MKSIPQNTPVQPTLFASSENDMIACLICGKQFQKMTTMHLKIHGLTCSAYKAMFPDALLTSQKLRDKLQTTVTKKVRSGYQMKARTGITQNCKGCGKPFYVRPCNIGISSFCSRRCNGIESSIHIRSLPRPTGPNNPRWRGGRYRYYYGPNWKRQQRLARERDGHTCQLCGKKEHDSKRKLDVHHIKDFREFGIERYQEANQLSNLVSLCQKCHVYVTNGVAVWPPT